MTKPDDVMLPNELERRQIFYTLKRWSSYTAWKRILDFYQVWSDAMEKVVSTCEDLPSDSPQYQHYKKVALGPRSLTDALKGLADVTDGVSSLRRGDKRVFKYSPYGEFFRGRLPLSHWTHFMNFFVLSDGWPLQPELIPHWPELEKARDDLETAWSECGPFLLEPNYMGKPTGAVLLLFNDWFKEKLSKMHFPTELPKIPSPAEEVLISTREDVKHSGIYEPIELPSRNIISLFKPQPPKGPFPISGTMSYLHGGTRAPKKAVYGDIAGKPTTWRLLWRDDRYLDGTIPEEEQHYVFLQPATPAEASASAPPATNDSMTAAESGQRAPAAGRWLVEDDLHASITVEKDQELPLHQGRKVRWVLASN